MHEFLISHFNVLMTFLVVGLPALWAAGSLMFGISAIAQPSINTYLYIGDGASPEGFTLVANVGDITGPGFSAAIVDVTSHSNPTPWREKITTLLDAGQVSFKLYFIPGDTGHQKLMKTFINRTFNDYKIVYPDPAHSTMLFSAYTGKFAITTTVAGVMEAAVTFEVVGQPTFWFSLP